MKVKRFYTDGEGRTRLEEIDLPIASKELQASGTLKLQVTQALFGGVAAGFTISHPAPRRQLVIILEGGIELECADGIVRLAAGDVCLVENTTGEGHVTRVVGEDTRQLMLPLPAELDVASAFGAGPGPNAAA